MICNAGARGVINLVSDDDDSLTGTASENKNDIHLAMKNEIVKLI